MNLRLWFMVSYDDNATFGLKGGDGVARGVPEGTREEWGRVLAAMLQGKSFHSKRLAYSPKEGVTSPRNTNSVADAFHTKDVGLIAYLLDHPQPWRPDHLSDAQPSIDYFDGLK